MPGRRIAFAERAAARLTSATCTLYTQPCPPGRMRYIVHLCIALSGTGLTNVSLFKETASGPFLYLQRSSLAAGASLEYPHRLRLEEGCRLVVSGQGGTAGGTVALYIEGYDELETPEGYSFER